MTETTEPDGAPRIPVLDILRGIAILGILFMNINDMGGAIWASLGDPRHFGWSESDRAVWWMREVVANGTARCVLQMLFGAGIVILAKRVSTAHYYRRNLILIGLGLVHVFVLLWPGDILHTYGIAALVAFAFRRLPAHGLIAIGLAPALLQLAGGGIGYHQAVRTHAAATAIETRMRAGTPPTSADNAILNTEYRATVQHARTRARIAANVIAEDRARRGGFGEWARAQWGFFAHIETHGFEPIFVIEAISVMLLGAGLFKLGIMQGSRSRAFYGAMTLAGYVIGVPLRIAGAAETLLIDDAPRLSMATAEVARIAMTIGHVGLVNLFVGTAIGAAASRPFAAAGRTALSIYILQTLIALWVLFPPFGFAFYGRMDWTMLLATALAIDIALLLAAMLYLRRFAIGPVEWAWRSLVEWRALPWR